LGQSQMVNEERDEIIAFLYGKFSVVQIAVRLEMTYKEVEKVLTDRGLITKIA
jgi:hypothetical protein